MSDQSNNTSPELLSTDQSSRRLLSIRKLLPLQSNSHGLLPTPHLSLPLPLSGLLQSPLLPNGEDTPNHNGQELHTVEPHGEDQDIHQDIPQQDQVTLLDHMVQLPQDTQEIGQDGPTRRNLTRRKISERDFRDKVLLFI